MTLKRFRPRRGFTLIELLVVVAIIALLISILLPSLSQARKQAKRVVCGTRLKDISVSLMSYSVDFGRFPLQNSGGPPGAARSERTAYGMWGYATHEYLAEQMGGLELNVDTNEYSITHDVFYCPEVPRELTHNAERISGPGTTPPFGLTDLEEQYLHISYQYYGRLDEVGNDPAETITNPQWQNEDWFLRRSKYADKEANADEILMADSVAWWGGQRAWRVNHYTGGRGWLPEQSGRPDDPPAIEGANQMFGDGHVEWMRESHFYPLTEKLDVFPTSRSYSLNANGDWHWW